MQITPEIIEDLTDKSKEFRVLLSEELNAHNNGKIIRAYAKIKQRDSMDNLYVGNSKEMFDQEIDRIPVMPPEESREKIIKYNKLQELISDCSDEAEKKRLSKEAVAIRNAIIEGNLRLIFKHAGKKSSVNSIPILDLINEGSIGISKAIDKFDVNAGTSFSTYADYWIVQSINRYIDECEQGYKMSVNAVQKLRKIKRYINKCMAQGYKPSQEEISKALSISLYMVKKLEPFLQDVKSLNNKINDKDDTELVDTIVDPSKLSPEEYTVNKINKKEVLELLLKIKTCRNQYVIEMRYGIIDGRSRTLEQVGLLLNQTREGIRQLEVKALTDMRNLSRKASRNFSNYFNTEEYKEVVNIIPKLPKKIQDLLYKRFGSNLDQLNEVSKEELIEVFKIIIFLREEIAKKLYVKINYIDTKSQIDNYEGKTIQEILKCSNEETEEVIKIIKRYSSLKSAASNFLSEDFKRIAIIAEEKVSELLKNIEYWKSILDYARYEKTGVINKENYEGKNNSKYEDLLLEEILKISYQELMALFTTKKKTYKDFIFEKMHGYDYRRPFNKLMLTAQERSIYIGYLPVLRKEISELISTLRSYEGKLLSDITGKSNESLEYFIYNKLKREEVAILKRIHGPNFNETFKKTKLNADEKLIYVLIVKNLKLKDPAYKMPVYTGKTLESILNINFDRLFEILDLNLKESLKAYHGESLREVYNPENQGKKYKSRYSNLIAVINKRISDIEEIEQFNGKTLEEIVGTPLTMLLPYLKNMHLSKYFGPNLQEPLDTSSLTALEKLSLSKNIRVIHTKLGNHKKEDIDENKGQTVEVLMPEEAIKVKSPLTHPIFKEAMKFMPEELKPVLELAIGTNDGFMYSQGDISNVLGIELSELKTRITNGLTIYQEIVISLTKEESNDNIKDELKLTLELLKKSKTR